jgi:hypothetical protein
MLTVALIVALVWVVLTPLLVLIATAVGWRVGEWRRAHGRFSQGAVVLFPGGRSSRDSAPATEVPGSALP